MEDLQGWTGSNSNSVADDPSRSDSVGAAPSFPKTMRGYQYRILFYTLEKNGWNRTYAARELDMGLRTVKDMLREIRRLGVEVPKSKKRSPARTGAKVSVISPGDGGLANSTLGR